MITGTEQRESYGRLKIKFNVKMSISNKIYLYIAGVDIMVLNKNQIF